MALNDRSNDANQNTIFDESFDYAHFEGRLVIYELMVTFAAKYQRIEAKHANDGKGRKPKLNRRRRA